MDKANRFYIIFFETVTQNPFDSWRNLSGTEILFSKKSHMKNFKNK